MQLTALRGSSTRATRRCARCAARRAPLLTPAGARHDESAHQQVLPGAPGCAARPRPPAGANARAELSSDEATRLHEEYYKAYGLAIEGLVRHHEIDPLEYNRKVDDALPLDDVIHADPALRSLIRDIDTSKIKLWLFTNAYVTHGERVCKMLGVRDLFSGGSWARGRMRAWLTAGRDDVLRLRRGAPGLQAQDRGVRTRFVGPCMARGRC